MRERVIASLAFTAALLVVLAACSWGQPGYDSGREGWSSADGSFTTSNVGSTKLLWEADGANGDLTTPAMDAQRIYFSSGPATSPGLLEAFNSDGGDQCAGSPRVCQPLWRAVPDVPDLEGPIVANGIVFVGGGAAGVWTVDGYDATGVRGCSGTPVVCQPVWRATWPGGVVGSRVRLMAAGNTLFASTESYAAYGGLPASVFAFDMAGVSGCTGASPTSCSPMFSAPTDGSPLYPSVANGLLFVPVGNGVAAYDAAGTNHCGGVPKVCQPLWRAATPSGTGYAVVSGGVLYTQTLVQPRNGAPWTGTVYAFDAAGQLGCSGVPKVCSPRFTFATGLNLLPVVANGRAFAVSGDQGGMALESFSANGTTGCTGTVPVCSHLSTASLPPGWASLAATKSVLFGLVSGGMLQAYALDGTGCTTATPSVCSPLLSIAVPSASGVEPAVANGRIAFTAPSPRAGLALFVYGLPN